MHARTSASKIDQDLKANKRTLRRLSGKSLVAILGFADHIRVQQG